MSQTTSPGDGEKNSRSGLQSAYDELIDKGAIITGGIVGCMRPELGEFIQ
jgi:hypothetical protein